MNTLTYIVVFIVGLILGIGYSSINHSDKLLKQSSEEYSRGLFFGAYYSYFNEKLPSVWLQEYSYKHYTVDMSIDSLQKFIEEADTSWDNSEEGVYWRLRDSIK